MCDKTLKVLKIMEILTAFCLMPTEPVPSADEHCRKANRSFRTGEQVDLDLHQIVNYKQLSPLTDSAVFPAPMDFIVAVTLAITLTPLISLSCSHQASFCIGSHWKPHWGLLQSWVRDNKWQIKRWVDVGNPHMYPDGIFRICGPFEWLQL